MVSALLATHVLILTDEDGNKTELAQQTTMDLIKQWWTPKNLHNSYTIPSLIWFLHNAFYPILRDADGMLAVIKKEQPWPDTVPSLTIWPFEEMANLAGTIDSVIEYY